MQNYSCHLQVFTWCPCLNHPKFDAQLSGVPNCGRHGLKPDPICVWIHNPVDPVTTIVGNQSVALGIHVPFGSSSSQWQLDPFGEETGQAFF